MTSRDGDRRHALNRVLAVLTHPLCSMSKPMREEALQLARVHDLTAAELIEYAYKRNRDA